MSSVHVKAALTEAREALDNLLADEAMLAEIDRAGEIMAEAIRSGRRIYSCGNGGSLCDAMHFAEEMTGRYRKTVVPMRQRPLQMLRIWRVWRTTSATKKFSRATSKAWGSRATCFSESPHRAPAAM